MTTRMKKANNFQIAKVLENTENHDSLIVQVISTIIYSIIIYLSALCAYGKFLKVLIKIINVDVEMKL